MTAQEILQRAVTNGLISSKGKTPLQTVRARLYDRCKRDPRLERIFDQGPTRAKRGSVRWRYNRPSSGPK